MATGEPLPEQVWSNKVWTTGFADALSLTGLTLSGSACTIYTARAMHPAECIPSRLTQLIQRQ